jgi:hypothetical protein
MNFNWVDGTNIIIKNYGGDAVLKWTTNNLQIYKLDGTLTTKRQWCALLARVGLIPTQVTEHGRLPICSPSTDLNNQKSDEFDEFQVTYWWWNPQAPSGTNYHGDAKMEIIDFNNPTRIFGTVNLPILTC